MKARHDRAGDDHPCDGHCVEEAASDAPAGAHPAGRITFVGTPIGNLGDMSPRAGEALRTADTIACEDTRRTGRLLQLQGIEAPRLVRMDDHTEVEVSARLVELARQGRSVAVTTDAGMPGLSDPGARLMQAALAAGVGIEVIPGPFAGAVAAVASGLLDPSGRFVFEGFLPRKGAARRALLSEVAAETRPVVLYESPHRVADTISDLVAACGAERRVALCRELTKLHEEVWRGTLADAAVHLCEHPARGEYALVLEGAPPPPEPTDEQLRVALIERLEAGASRRDAAAEVARSLGVSPNRVKRLAVD